MTFGPIQIRDLLELLPYGILSVSSLLLLLFASMTGERGGARKLYGALTFGAVVATLTSLLFVNGTSMPLRGLLIHDGLGFGFAAVVLLLLLFAVPVFHSGTARIRRAPAGTYSLLLLSAAGGLLMIFSNHLLVFFVGLELLSLPLYVMTGLGATKDESSEAAFKYFLLGAVASAVLVYGMALMWGTLGTLEISSMAQIFHERGFTSGSLLMVGVTLFAAGILFKIGLVPFHMWVPDVYQGAPAPLVAWMSGAVKASVLCTALRLFGRALPSTSFNWVTALSWLAMASMVWGSLAALYQTDVKRMLAYSSVAHAGYAAIALTTSEGGSIEEAGAALVFYVLTYGLATFGAFLVVSLQEEEGKTKISDLSGLAKRRPGLALALAICLLSLAGLPPLAGFVAKFNVFLLAAQQGRYELVLVGVVTSVVSLAYYLRLIVAAYMEDPAELTPIRRPFGAVAALGLASAFTLLLGLLPGSVLDFLLRAGSQGVR
ncbi:MAG TPA: NADH-quinone oxidoreductase subunit N [Bdellovibrionota bacterium]|nr:NADH-quinone oxidoreductase subunit N [Bdellovibrionota bacterium]